MLTFLSHCLLLVHISNKYFPFFLRLCWSHTTLLEISCRSSNIFHFSAMNVLDGDEVRLSYNGVYAQRDIVQVWKFNSLPTG